MQLRIRKIGSAYRVTIYRNGEATDRDFDTIDAARAYAMNAYNAVDLEGAQ